MKGPHDPSDCDEGCTGCHRCYLKTGQWFCDQLCDHAPHCRTCEEPYDPGDSEADDPEVYCCPQCERDWHWQEEQDEAYERAAARARLNDFEDTGGKDWT